MTTAAAPGHFETTSAQRVWVPFCSTGWDQPHADPDHACLLCSAIAAAHRLVAIADQPGSRVDYTLDAMGNRINERAIDHGGTLLRIIQRSIDALNRVQQVIGAH